MIVTIRAHRLLLFIIAHIATTLCAQETQSLNTLLNTTDKFYGSLDNIPFQDYSKLLNTPPSKIVSIKVIAEPYVCGNEIIYGIVSIHSATGDLAGLGLPKNVAAVDYITLNPSATISYDEYIQSVNADKRTPDFRSTLYWNPNIVLTNEDQSLQFYTSDCTCDYDIIIRGIDANGEPIFSSKTITVVK